MLILQQEAQEQEALQEKERTSSRKGKLTFAEGEHFVTAPNTPSVVDPLSDERKKRDEKDLLSLHYDADGSELAGRIAPITPGLPYNCLSDVKIEGTHSTVCHISRYTSQYVIIIATFFHFLIGTPSARPILWMVKQVSTEVKKLRERAERSQDSSNANIRLAMKYNCDEKKTV